jgi:hypothetical protein
MSGAPQSPRIAVEDNGQTPSLRLIHNEAAGRSVYPAAVTMKRRAVRFIPPQFMNW